MLPLTLSLVLLPTTCSQTGDLEISNVRPTLGYLGAPRPKRDGVLPGDIIHFTFDIKNLKLDALGNASYSIAVAVHDPMGKIVYRQPPYNVVARNFLGGDRLPASAHLQVPHEAKPGDYQLEVTIEDRAAKKKATFTRQGKVLPKGFGLIQVATFSDAEGKVPAPGACVVGSTLYLRFAAVGFERDPAAKQPRLQSSLRILDDKGRPTIPQPLTGKIDENVPEDLDALVMQFGLTLNRAGRFTLELTARDQVSGKSDTMSFPLRVVDLE